MTTPENKKDDMNENASDKKTKRSKVLSLFSRFFNRLVDSTTAPKKGEKKELASNWMSPVSSAYHGQVKTSYKLTAYLISAFCLVFVIWATFFEIDEFVHAPGTIEPETEVKSISHFEGGIIQEIKVKEGDRVKKGQVLFILKDESVKANYAENLEAYHKSWAEKLRLKAQIERTPLVLPKEIEQYSPTLAASTMARYHQRENALKNEEEIASGELAQHRSSLNTTKERIKSLESLYKIADEKVTILKKLMDQKLVAKTQYLQTKLEAENHLMELETAKNNIHQILANIREDEDKLQQVRHTYDNRDWQELKDQENRYEEAKKGLLIAKDRSERAEIRSPIDGIIKEIFEKTIGSAVMAGKVLASIVPLDDIPIVEAHVTPNDIGFIKVGDSAIIKVTAFDYSIYGVLTGIVEQVSADAIQDPKDPQKIYFKVRIKTDKRTFSHRGESFKMGPGMTVDASIKTGTRTVMHYLLKPVVKTLENPLGEK